MMQSVVLLMCLGVFIFVHMGNSQETIVRNAKDVEDLDVKQIIWEKDGAKMALIPAQSSYNELYDQIRRLIPSKMFETSNTFYIDCTEVTVGQFKKFLQSTDYEFEVDLWVKISKY